MLRYLYLISQLAVDVNANAINMIVVKLRVTVRLVENKVKSHVGSVIEAKLTVDKRNRGKA